MVFWYPVVPEGTGTWRVDSCSDEKEYHEENAKALLLVGNEPSVHPKNKHIHISYTVYHIKYILKSMQLSLN